jgi:hypothetical protein
MCGGPVSQAQAGLPEPVPIPGNCLAKVWGGGAYPQCRAKARKGSPWCGIHQSARPNGQLLVEEGAPMGALVLQAHPKEKSRTTEQTGHRMQMMAPAWSRWLDAQSAPLPGAASSSSGPSAGSALSCRGL